MRRARLSAVVAVVAGALVPAADAHAIERQHHFGLAPQLAILKVDGKSSLDVGAGGAIHYAYGLNDMFNLMAEGGSAVVAANQDQDTPTTPKNRPAAVDHATVGIGYVFDVLRWVPTASVLAGGYRMWGGTLDHSLFIAGASVGLGLDYQLSRSWAVGVAGRQHFLFTKLSDYPSYTTATLRFEYMWGY